MKLTELNESQLNHIASTNPAWLVERKPMWMVYNYPEWVAKYDPDTMLKHRPSWMVKNNPQAVAIKKPELLLNNSFDKLCEYNLNWVIAHHPAKLAYEYPDLLKQYDLSMFRVIRSELHPVKLPFFKAMKNKLFSVMHQYTKTKTLDDKVPAEYLKPEEVKLVEATDSPVKESYKVERGF